MREGVVLDETRLQRLVETYAQRGSAKRAEKGKEFFRGITTGVATFLNFVADMVVNDGWIIKG